MTDNSGSFLAKRQKRRRPITTAYRLIKVLRKRVLEPISRDLEKFEAAGFDDGGGDLQISSGRIAANSYCNCNSSGYPIPNDALSGKLRPLERRRWH